MTDLSEGTLLQNRYTIKQSIGKGAMGTIYLVKDSRLPDDRALKEMNPTFLEDSEREQFLELFKQEAHILSRLHHANLPKVIDYFFEHDRYYLVMDYIKGKNLKDYREKNPILTKDQIVKIISQICDVLEYLHNQKIIFRDLKPSNIMITEDETIKLIDFGIARIFKESKKSDTVIVGTPGFSPPEQYGKRQTDERSDIYSLGATLYYLLTGDVPDIPDQKGRKEVESHINIKPAMRSVILKCLNPEPQERYSSIKEFRQAFLESQEKPLEVPAKKEPVKEITPEEHNEPDSIIATANTFGFMLIPSVIFAFLFYLARLIMRLDLRYEITLYILPILGTGALTVLWSGLIKKLKKLTGFNWEALIILTVPLALLNAFSIFYLLIPEYYADKIGLWTKIVLLCIIMPLMYLVSFILIKFFRHKPKVSQEIKVVETRKKEDLIGCSATVTVPLKPTGKVVVDGDEENLTASSKSGQFINEGARVKIVTIKMGDLLVEEITE